VSDDIFEVAVSEKKCKRQFFYWGISFRPFLSARRYASADTIAMAPCPCLPSLTSREFSRNGWTGGFFRFVLHCYKKNFLISKIRVGLLPFGTLPPNSGLKKSQRHIDCRNASSTKLDKRDKLDRRRSVDNTSDDRPLVYYSDCQAPSTAQCRCAGPLATADTRMRSNSYKENFLISRNKGRPRNFAPKLWA